MRISCPGTGAVYLNEVATMLSGNCAVGAAVLADNCAVGAAVSMGSGMQQGLLCNTKNEGTDEELATQK